MKEETQNHERKPTPAAGCQTGEGHSASLPLTAALQEVKGVKTSASPTELDEPLDSNVVSLGDAVVKMLRKRF